MPICYPNGYESQGRLGAIEGNRDISCPCLRVVSSSADSIALELGVWLPALLLLTHRVINHRRRLISYNIKEER